jgi:hypothetical protein
MLDAASIIASATPPFSMAAAASLHTTRNTPKPISYTTSAMADQTIICEKLSVRLIASESGNENPTSAPTPRSARLLAEARRMKCLRWN